MTKKLNICRSEEEKKRRRFIPNHNQRTTHWNWLIAFPATSLQWSYTLSEIQN